jgi:uncharacterized repeat protein (TIGR04076 family)
MTTNSKAADEFQLFDLRVEVVCPPGKRIMCGAKEGDYFTLEGEMLYLPPKQGISIYSLCKFSTYHDIFRTDTQFIPASVLPLLAAKQRPTSTNDWMLTDALIACPDPCCPSQLKITRAALRTFRHSETTAVPLTGNAES